MGAHTPLAIQIVEHIATYISYLAIAVLVWGVLVGAVELLRLESRRLRRHDIAADRDLIRRDVGYYILLSLEFLIAADIIHTILKPTLKDLAVLGAIVAIRTVINIFLTRDIGHTALRRTDVK
jgi:uncharacterized membrane protein